ncbi:MAG: DUF2085 domain-containing protein [Candidatus Dojkabacteria bacterium]|nr:DUF2085 domain-containing protein [Candidatus Dojkabacteria bacterium]
MPERSFFWKEYQFPVCARCFGMLIGHLLGVLIFIFYRLPIVIAIVLCLITFIDWFIQYLGIFESTNWRRLITGILGGIGVVIIPLSLISMLYVWISGL